MFFFLKCLNVFLDTQFVLRGKGDLVLCSSGGHIESDIWNIDIFVSIDIVSKQNDHMITQKDQRKKPTKNIHIHTQKKERGC